MNKIINTLLQLAYLILFVTAEVYFGVHAFSAEGLSDNCDDLYIVINFTIALTLVLMAGVLLCLDEPKRR